MLALAGKKTLFAAIVLGLWVFIPPASAEEMELEIFAPWDAEGKMYRIGPNQVQFNGAMEGVMYVKDSQGELDAALFVCPVRVDLDEETDRTRASGNCHIVAAEGNVFGRFECEGKKGGCSGQFEITAGTDALEGTTGSGAMTIRTVLTSSMRDAVSGAVVTEATGLAVWPSLKVNIPGSTQ